MKDDRWQRQWQIFHEAEELPEEQRPALLDEACGEDRELRAEIEGLLALSGDDGFLERPAVLVNEDDLAKGDRVGPYRLERVLGEGGMGVVWSASQEQPIRRTVALKVIKLGMDTREVIRRFESERQTLARVEHSHIARSWMPG